MKKWHMAIAASLLVFPGTGHFLLKRKKSAIALIVASFITLSIVLNELGKIIWKLMQQVINGEIDGDIATLTALTHQELYSGHHQALMISAAALAILWLVSTVDCLRIGLSNKT